jgi:hypothetical protein
VAAVLMVMVVLGAGSSCSSTATFSYKVAIAEDARSTIEKDYFKIDDWRVLTRRSTENGLTKNRRNRSSDVFCNG